MIIKAINIDTKITVDAVEFDGTNHAEIITFGNGKINSLDKNLTLTNYTSINVRIKEGDYVVDEKGKELRVYSRMKFNGRYDIIK